MGLFGNKKDKPLYVSVKHVSGLDVPEGLTCNFTVSGTDILIAVGNTSYKLMPEKISSVNFEMDVDVQKYNKSNILKGVIGAATFGVSGAIIGSSPKLKTERKVTGCIIINYTSSADDSTYLIFEDCAPNSLQAANLVDKIKPMVNKTSPSIIEL